MRRTCLAILVALTLLPLTAIAKDLDSADEPAAGSGMPTLQEIYDYLVSGAEPSGFEMFQEPSAGPEATMKTLKQLYEDVKVLLDLCTVTPDKVLKGQTFFRTTGTWGPQEGTMPYVGQQIITPGTIPQPIGRGYHDGSGMVAGDPNLVPENIRAYINIYGVTGRLKLMPFCIPECKGTLSGGGRWCDNGDGTVTDRTTGLVWLQNANCFGAKTWKKAWDYASYVRHGECGLSDGSAYNSWRLPTSKELYDLAHGREAIRADSPGPFSDVVSGGIPSWYQTSSTSRYNANFVAVVSLEDGEVTFWAQPMACFILLVRIERTDS